MVTSLYRSFNKHPGSFVVRCDKDPQTQGLLYSNMFLEVLYNTTCVTLFLLTPKPHLRFSTYTISFCTQSPLLFSLKTPLPA